MVLEKDFFGRHRPDFAKMKAAGFREEGEALVYEEDFLDGQFRAVLSVGRESGGAKAALKSSGAKAALESGGAKSALKSNGAESALESGGAKAARENRNSEVRGSVIDLDTGEEYLPLRAKRQIGGFVGEVREAYLQVLENVRAKCFRAVDFRYDQSNRISALIGESFGAAPEFPWEKYPGNGAYKCGNGKWFALILTVEFGKLQPAEAQKAGRHDASEIVEVINLKADPERIPELIHGRGVYAAWHMNKKHWISVILDDTLQDGDVMELISESFGLVNGKAAAGRVTGDAWIIPSNPKIYDVDAGFAAGGGVIEWHQHNSIKAGDELYIYSTAPNSAILYRCAVEAADLKYHGMFTGKKGYVRSMRIRLVEKYPPDRFPLSFMKENGGSVIRSARRMPQQLLEAMRKK